MRARRSAAAMILIAAAAVQSAAQTGVISGTVYRDSAGHQLAAAEVLLPDLNRHVSANWAGEFKFVQLPAGRHVIVIRHVGFTPLTDTVDVANGATIDREFILTEQPASLDTVTVKASPRRYISPALQEFEERRKAGFGHFIDEEEMRKNNERRLIDVIQGHVPGVSTFNMKGSGSIVGEYLASGRKCGAGPTFLSCKGGPQPCPVTRCVVHHYTVEVQRDDARQMPDLSRYNTRDYAGVEYYAGGASMPVKYNATSSGCGVLLLWTRER